MTRVTKSDVREKVDYLNKICQKDFEISHTPQGYHLVEADTHNRIGPICNSSSEFMIFLRGFDYGRKYE